MRVFIISRDLEKRQLSLGLKPSYFTGDEDEVEPHCERLQDNELKVHGTLGGSDSDEERPHDSDSDNEELLTDSDGDDDDDGDGDDDDDGDDITMQIDLAPPDSIDSPKLLGRQDTDVLSLKVNGFQWFVNDTGPEEQSGRESESDQSDGEEISVEKKKRKRRKEIETDVTADMQTKLPDSNADFERMLLGSPDSSYLWIQYMSFQLQLSEIDKARAIGKRAIQTIHFREEQEKLNVWIALLNLENVYGTDATIGVVFKDAVRYNDSKTIYLRLAAIFDESKKYEVPRNALLLSEPSP